MKRYNFQFEISLTTFPQTNCQEDGKKFNYFRLSLVISPGMYESLYKHLTIFVVKILISCQ